MKKLFFFASVMTAALSLNAQTTTTITVDGNPAEWAEIPMITEPGVAGNMLKYALNQEGISVGTGNAFAVLLQTDSVVEADKTMTIYVDADKSSATGQQMPWFLKNMYRDYELGVNGQGQGITDAQRATSGKSTEISMPTSAFNSVPFNGSFWGYFSYNWGKFYVPNSPEGNMDNWKWDQTNYQPTDVRPFAYTAIAGTHAFADTWSRHQCIALGDSMKFNVSGGAQDTAFWCAWTVEITAGAKYDVTAGVTSDNTASLDLYLVDVATNTLVDSITCANVWAPEETITIGEWDLSAVPAGKYMLKAKNHVAWSHMKMTSVTLTAKSTTAVREIATPVAPVQKRMLNGRLIISRDGQHFSAQGQRL